MHIPRHIVGICRSSFRRAVQISHLARKYASGEPFRTGHQFSGISCFRSGELFPAALSRSLALNRVRGIEKGESDTAAPARDKFVPGHACVRAPLWWYNKAIDSSQAATWWAALAFPGKPARRAASTSSEKSLWEIDTRARDS